MLLFILIVFFTGSFEVVFFCQYCIIQLNNDLKKSHTKKNLRTHSVFFLNKTLVKSIIPSIRKYSYKMEDS